MMKKEKFILILLTVILIPLLSGCKGEKEGNGNQIRSSGGTSGIKYSKNFSIEYKDGYKVVTVYTPDEKHSLVFRYILVPRGNKAPAGYEGAMVVNTPVKSVVSLSSLYIGFLDKLNLAVSIIAVDKFRYVISPDVQNLIKEGKITEAGESFSLNIEKIMQLNPELVLTFGTGNPAVDGNPMLVKSGIHIASSTIHLESSPLARAEWIKFVAAFFDKDAEADSIFNGLALRYEKLASLTKNIASRPTVFTEALFGGMWYEPGGNSYMAKYLNDAGADYLWKDDPSSGSLKLTFEQVYARAHNADFWINVPFWKNLGDALKNDPRNADFKAYRNKNIYNYSLKMNDAGFFEYWENGIINCDLVLSDLIKIFHPRLLPGYKMTYYKKLEEQ